MGVGWLALKLVTFGRYRRDEGTRLAEGAVGLGVLALVAFVTYRSAPVN